MTNYRNEIKAHNLSHQSEGNLWFRDFYEPHDYLTSYDAIIPLIQKQTDDIKSDTVEKIYGMGDRQLDRTPSQLCEALLRATGKWKE